MAGTPRGGLGARAGVWLTVASAAAGCGSGCAAGAAGAAARSRALPGPFAFPGSSFASFLDPPRPGLGYPPIPFDGYPSWRMNDSTAAYFLGNDTGLNNPAEIAAQARFAIVGTGWQLGMRMASAPWAHLERKEAATAAAIKAVNPATKVLVSRNVEVGGIFWDHDRHFFVDHTLAKASGLWVTGQPGTQTASKPHCAVGQLCNGSWGCANCGPIMPFDGLPGIPYGQLRFNWSSSPLVPWWLDQHLGSAVNQSGIDGVHFDCECGDDNGVAVAKLRGFDGDAVAGFGRHLGRLAAARKMSIAWTGEHVFQQSCDADMARLRRAYTNDPNQTFQLSYENKRGDFNQTLAAFLILRGEHALLEFGVIGPYECASEPCGCGPHSTPDRQCPHPGHYPGGGYGPYRWSPLLDHDFGVPLEAPRVAGRVWSRTWSKLTVALDCARWTATIAF